MSDPTQAGPASAADLELARRALDRGVVDPSRLRQALLLCERLAARGTSASLAEALASVARAEHLGGVPPADPHATRRHPDPRRTPTRDALAEAAALVTRPAEADPPAVRSFLAAVAACPPVPAVPVTLERPEPGRPPLEAPPGGRRLGRYQLLRELGAGGAGLVYEARDLQLGRAVAIKVLRGADLAGARQRARFEREARAAAALRHENVVGLLDCGQEGDHPFLVMELVPGETLQARVDRVGPLDAREAARLVEAVARGVGHAHGRGVLHRDVKPANVLIDAAGTARLTDFGMARDLACASRGLTATGEVVGTPSFAAPEQARGERAVLGPATDVYGLGATLYYALTGRPPFEGRSVVETLTLLAREEVEPPSRRRPDLDPDLEAVCLRCLAKRPEARYPSADAVAADLLRYRRGLPVAARTRGPGRLRRALRARPVLARVVLYGLLALAASAAFLWPRLARQELRSAEAGAAEPDPRYAAEVRPAHALALLKRGLALEARDPAAAEAALRAALVLEPELPLAHRELGWVLMRQGRGAEAAATIERALELDPHDAKALVHRGVLRRRLRGDAAGALADYSRALDLGLDDAALRSNRAIVLLQLGDLARARTDLDRALELQPRDAYSLTLRGLLHNEAGDWEAARRDLDRALEIEPGEPEARYHRAVACFRLGDLRTALADCEAALAALPPGAPQADGVEALRRAVLDALAGRR